MFLVISALPPETSWEKLLQALKIKYQDKAPYDVLMAQFYGTKIEPDEKCASFGTRLENKLNQVCNIQARLVNLCIGIV